MINYRTMFHGFNASLAMKKPLDSFIFEEEFMKDLYVSDPPYGGFSAYRFESRALAFNIAESDKELIEPELAAWGLEP